MDLYIRPSMRLNAPTTPTRACVSSALLSFERERSSRRWHLNEKTRRKFRPREVSNYTHFWVWRGMGGVWGVLGLIACLLVDGPLTTRPREDGEALLPQDRSPMAHHSFLLYQRGSTVFSLCNRSSFPPSARLLHPRMEWVVTFRGKGLSLKTFYAPKPISEGAEVPRLKSLSQWAATAASGSGQRYVRSA